MNGIYLALFGSLGTCTPPLTASLYLESGEVSPNSKLLRDPCHKACTFLGVCGDRNFGMRCATSRSIEQMQLRV